MFAEGRPAEIANQSESLQQRAEEIARQKVFLAEGYLESGPAVLYHNAPNFLCVVAVPENQLEQSVTAVQKGLVGNLQRDVSRLITRESSNQVMQLASEDPLKD